MEQFFLLTRSWTDERILDWVEETFYNDEANPKTDRTFDETRSLLKWKLDWLMKVVWRCLNRIWTHDFYFSLRRPVGHILSRIYNCTKFSNRHTFLIRISALLRAHIALTSIIDQREGGPGWVDGMSRYCLYMRNKSFRMRLTWPLLQNTLLGWFIKSLHCIVMNYWVVHFGMCGMYQKNSIGHSKSCTVQCTHNNNGSCHLNPFAGITPFLLPVSGAGTTFQHPYVQQPSWTCSDSKHTISRNHISGTWCVFCQGILVTACAVLWTVEIVIFIIIIIPNYQITKNESRIVNRLVRNLKKLLVRKVVSMVIIHYNCVYVGNCVYVVYICVVSQCV